MKLTHLLLAVCVLSMTAPVVATPTPTVTDSSPVPDRTATSTTTVDATSTPTPTDTIERGDPEYTPIRVPRDTPTSTPTATPGLSRTRGEANGRNIELSGVTTISRYWYTDGYFVVELRSQMSTDVTIVESIGERGDGAHRLNKRTVPISSGRSLVRLKAPSIGGEASATITTQQAEYVIGLRSSQGFDLLDGPYPGNAVAASAGAGILMAGLVLPVGLTILRGRRKGGRFL